MISTLLKHYQHWQHYCTNSIFTSHAGEAARLLNCSTTMIQQDRQHAIKKIQHRYHNIMVLKGHHSLIAGKETPIYCCQAGNPGMASAGMGDLLSGVIAALVGQGLSLLDAAAYGVCLHASAGDLVASKQGQRGLLATELLPFIRQLINQ